jgi:hypothetical protein
MFIDSRVEKVFFPNVLEIIGTKKEGAFEGCE